MSTTQHDPFLGQWHLNPEKSTYQLGQPPKAGSYTLEQEGERIKVTMDWITADDQHFNQAYYITPDGLDYPYENPQVAETVSATRVDARTLDTDAKKGGLVINHARRVLSDDGQVMTITMSTHTADGKQFHNLAIYERTR